MNEGITMRLEQIKADDIATSCPLAGVKIVEVRKSQYAVTSITLMDSDGHVLVIEGAEYTGSVRVLAKAKPRTRKQYTLTGQFFTGSIGLEVNINETFDDSMAAMSRKNHLSQNGGSNLTITETEIEVPETE